MKGKFTKEFLISELHRFIEENDRNPKMADMQIKFGYPSGGVYQNRFETWNNALLEAGLELNQLDGAEICSDCKNRVNHLHLVLLVLDN